MNFLNLELIERFPIEEFQKRRPFPWFDIEQFLTITPLPDSKPLCRSIILISCRRAGNRR